MLLGTSLTLYIILAFRQEGIDYINITLRTYPSILCVVYCLNQHYFQICVHVLSIMEEKVISSSDAGV